MSRKGAAALKYRTFVLALLLMVVAGAIPAREGALGGMAFDWNVFARPTPLDAQEETSPAALQLARQYNPAMALPDAHAPWPVAVDYTWSAGAHLRARTLDAEGQAALDTVAMRADRLATTRWDHLPEQDARGRALEYWIDVPGDDRSTHGVSEWRRRWTELTRDTATGVPADSPHPPTQYAHLFWLNRGRGLLVIQYWFYFPFNEWINHHEGDWEHVNVVVEGASHLGPTATFHPVGYEFYFHGWRSNPDRVVRVADSAGKGDHVVVYVGGRGRFLWWSGSQSGGSYPLPASYRGVGAGVGSLRPAEDTRNPGRFIAADAFQVVMLPEPARLDAAARPALSWLKLPFYAGSLRSLSNPPLLDRFGGGCAPLQPARRRDWNTLGTKPLWNGLPTVADHGAPVPSTWALLPGSPAPGPRLARLGDGADGTRRATP